MRTQSAAVLSPRSIFTVVCSTGCTDTVRRVMSQSGDPRVAHKQNNNSSPGFYPADFTILDNYM